MQYHLNLFIAVISKLCLIDGSLIFQSNNTKVYLELFNNLIKNEKSDYQVVDNITIDKPKLKLNVNVSKQDHLKLIVSTSQQYKALRISTQCENCTKKNPLIITIRRPNEVVSWKLPVSLPIHSSNQSSSNQNKEVTYDKISRTLPPLNAEQEEHLYYVPQNNTEYYSDEKLLFEEVNIYFYTNYHESRMAEFSLEIEDFEIEGNLQEFERGVNKTTKIAPTEPRYFRFSFPNITDDENGHYSRYFLEAKSEDNSCMILSIQDSQWPVHDLISNVKFRGDYQTVNRSGAMFISKQEFGEAVHIVMVVLPGDAECHLNPFRTWEKVVNDDDFMNDTREKTVTLTITTSPGTKEYNKVIVGTLLGFIAFSLVVIFISCTQGGYDLYYNNVSRKDVIKTRIAPDDHHVQYAFLYLKALWIVALFYGIPVVQLVLSYERFTNDRGNKDQCYFNFKCAHALVTEEAVKISDFNHVFSNIGYVILGVLSFFCIRIHQLRTRLAIHVSSIQEKNSSGKKEASPSTPTVPFTVDDAFVLKDYGLYYALASAIILQGIMSMCYHICPNNVNFQFDTIFMFAINVITMVTIYNRLNPWQAISVFTVYGILSMILFFAIMGVYIDAERYTKKHSQHVLFRSIASFIKEFIALFFCYLCYTEQRIKLTLPQLKKFFKATGNLLKGLRNVESGQVKDFFQPTKPKRLLVIVIWYVFNIFLSKIVIFGDFNYLMGLLFTLTTNTLFFIALYFALKLIYREHITKITYVCMLLTILAWVPALIYFNTKVKNDEDSPAMSREMNRKCLSWTGKFYDEHDVWHFFGAVGLFMNLMILITLDDGLRCKPKRDAKDDFRIRGEHLDEDQRARPMTMIFE